MRWYRSLRPWLVALLLGALVGVQLYALGQQFRLGFRPFAHAPGRVPFSWDMFAPALSRCDVRWSPALQVAGRPVSSFTELGVRFEWDPVMDSVEHYQQLALWACSEYGTPEGHASLLCFTPDGQTRRHELSCR